MAAQSILVIQNDPSDPVGVLGEWLIEAGAALEIRNAFAEDELPSRLDGFGGLLVLGAGVGARDDARAPWLSAVRALLREALAREVPTLGICLGAQLLALEGGGRVEPNPDGPEFGAQLVAKRAGAGTDPLFGPLPITPDVLQWHHDAIGLPPGATLLATSPVCEVQAFRVGRLAWGVQFHIETTPATVREWAAENTAVLAEYDVPTLLARSDTVHVDIAETWRPFAARFVAVVRDPAAVRPLRPIVASRSEPITDPAEIRAALAAQMRAARGHGPPPHD